jgi:hypothetical protein
MLIRSPAAHGKIQEHHEKLDTENTDEIHEREPDLSDLKPVSDRNGGQERNEHPDQDEQKDLNHVSMLCHMSPCNDSPLKNHFLFPEVSFGVLTPGDRVLPDRDSTVPIGHVPMDEKSKPRISHPLLNKLGDGDIVRNATGQSDGLDA